MLKNMFSLVVFLLLFYTNNYSLLANELENKKLYINVLDTDGSFEDKLLFNCNNSIYEESPVKIKQIYGDGITSNLYRINREYLPTDINKFVDMNGPEEYFLRIFKDTDINREYIKISISPSPVYSTWFSLYLHIKIGKKEGMLPFLNTNNLNLLDTSTENQGIQLSEKEKHKASIAMNQFFEMAGGVARQLELQKNINHRNILSVFKESHFDLITIPDDTFINDIFKKTHSYSINSLICFMSSIANTVAYLHEHGIIHGDMKLSNLFVVKDEIVLSGLERFSILQDENKDFGVKNFTFYNNIYCAPEIRFPIDKKSKWDYTNATYKSDIYSLGMLFAGILYLFLPSGYDTKFLKRNQDLPSYVKNEQLKAVLFDRYPFGVKQYIKNTFPKELLSRLYLYKNMLSSYFTDQTEKDEHNYFLRLINIINQCHNEDPEKRPSADKIADDLRNIIQENTIQSNI